MRFTINEKSLLEANDEKLVNAYSKYVKNILRNKTNMILELTRVENAYEANFYENNMPTAYFGPLYLPTNDPVAVGEVFYVELTPKALALLVPEETLTTFELKPGCMVIKQGPLIIKDSYESSIEEVQAKLDSYIDLFDNKEGDILTFTKEDPLALYFAILSSNPLAYLDIIDYMAVYRQGTFLHRFPTDIPGDYFINSYLALKLTNMLTYCDKVEFIKNSTITIKGYLNNDDKDAVVINVSPVYDREEDPWTEEDIQAIRPSQSESEVETVLFEELLNVFNVAKTKIRTFLEKDANLCTFAKNGKGCTFMLSAGDEEIGMTDIAINVGEVETEELEREAYVPYKINLPLQYFKNTQLGAVNLSIIHDHSDQSLVEIKLDNQREGEVMVIGKE